LTMPAAESDKMGMTGFLKATKALRPAPDITPLLPDSLLAWGRRMKTQELGFDLAQVSAQKTARTWGTGKSYFFPSVASNVNSDPTVIVITFVHGV
jgi:hypothetical protein